MFFSISSLSIFFLFCFPGDCPQGYYKSSQDEISAVFQCNPINECLNASTCHPNATCHYSGPGSHQCQCQEGFTGNGTHCSRKYICFHLLFFDQNSWSTYSLRIPCEIRDCCRKVRIFWEGHKIWKNVPLKIWRYWVASNSKRKNFLILWPSQNIRTLSI